MTTSSIISKSVLVLNAICSGRERLNFSQIVDAVGLPKSSTHRILSILQEEGLVTLDPVRNVFGPGLTLTGWATNVFVAGGLPEVAAPTLSRLSADVKCSTGLSILDPGIFQHAVGSLISSDRRLAGHFRFKRITTSKRRPSRLYKACAGRAWRSAHTFFLVACGEVEA